MQEWSNLWILFCSLKTRRCSPVVEWGPVATATWWLRPFERHRKCVTRHTEAPTSPRHTGWDWNRHNKHKLLWAELKMSWDGWLSNACYKSLQKLHLLFCQSIKSNVEIFSSLSSQILQEALVYTYLYINSCILNLDLLPLKLFLSHLAPWQEKVFGERDQQKRFLLLEWKIQTGKDWIEFAVFFINFQSVSVTIQHLVVVKVSVSSSPLVPLCLFRVRRLDRIRADNSGDTVHQLNRSLVEASSSLQQLQQLHWLDHRYFINRYVKHHQGNNIINQSSSVKELAHWPDSYMSRDQI